MRRLIFIIGGAAALVTLLIGGHRLLAQQTQPFTLTGVYAEAQSTANLRAGIGIETEIVGEIAVGTRYPVIGRSEFFPWLLLGNLTDAQPFGWVFQDIVTVYGDLALVPFTDINVTTFVSVAAATATPPAGAITAAPPDPNTTPTLTLTPEPQFSVSGVTQGEINVRYRPDASSERLGVAAAGTTFEIVGYHTQLAWVQIVYPAAPEGVAWVARDLLTITGDYTTTREISTTNFSNLPTLTPTSAVLGSSSVLRVSTVVPVSAEFEALGNQLWKIMLDAGFDPQTSRFGALYLHDLATGQEIMFGNEVAFSGTSINKVGILVDLFGALNGDPDISTAMDIANMMICSENVATNRMLSLIGAGDMYAGSESVSALFTRIGLQRTFLTAPFEIPGATPVPPTRPIRYPQTSAEQQKANPNVTNQMTVDELGYVLTGMYDCAFNEGGVLMQAYPDQYTPQECRKMLHVMANNNVDALLKAGVPETVTVAHKHGWVPDTHGNAAIFFTPGGDYVLVAMLHQPEWLDYQDTPDAVGSLRALAEVSRAVYNWYNPDAPLDAIREGFIPDANTCQYRGTPLVNDLADPSYGLTAPEFRGDIITIGGS